MTATSKTGNEDIIEMKIYAQGGVMTASALKGHWRSDRESVAVNKSPISLKSRLLRRGTNAVFSHTLLPTDHESWLRGFSGHFHTRQKKSLDICDSLHTFFQIHSIWKYKSSCKQCICPIKAIFITSCFKLYSGWKISIISSLERQYDTPHYSTQLFYF